MAFLMLLCGCTNRPQGTDGDASGADTGSHAPSAASRAVSGAGEMSGPPSSQDTAQETREPEVSAHTDPVTPAPQEAPVSEPEPAPEPVSTYSVAVCADHWGAPVGQRVYTDEATVEAIRDLLPDVEPLEKEIDPPDGGIPLIVRFYENEILTGEWTCLSSRDYTLISHGGSGLRRAPKDLFDLLAAYTDWDMDLPIAQQVDAPVQ